MSEEQKKKIEYYKAQQLVGKLKAEEKKIEEEKKEEKLNSGSKEAKNSDIKSYGKAGE